MNNLTEKTNSAKLLLQTKDPKIIELIREIFEREASPDFWNDLSTDQKSEINAASLEIENGEVIDYDLFIARHR